MLNNIVAKNIEMTFEEVTSTNYINTISRFVIFTLNKISQSLLPENERERERLFSHDS